MARHRITPKEVGMTQQKDSAVWRFQVWASFIIASLSTGAGIIYLPVDIWIKGFLGMGMLFTMGSCFSLSKTMRDAHEQEKLHQKLTEAKTHRLLKDFEMEDMKQAS
jgi:hypothetical protein